MSLKDFIEKFVGRNSLIRLWCMHKNGGYQMISSFLPPNERGSGVCMEWQILKGLQYKEYLNNNVLFVKDIVVDKFEEAINIVIEI